MSLASDLLPTIVIHADWSVDSRKSWLCEAAFGTFGLLNIVLGKRPPHDPLDTVLRRIEGWTLGQRPEN